MTPYEAAVIVNAMPDAMDIDEFVLMLVMAGAEFERRHNADFVLQFFKVSDSKGATICSDAIRARGENGHRTDD
jgi:hypothetical protein